MGLNDDKTSNDKALEINLGEYGDLEVIYIFLLMYIYVNIYIYMYIYVDKCIQYMSDVSSSCIIFLDFSCFSNACSAESVCLRKKERRLCMCLVIYLTKHHHRYNDYHHYHHPH
jgi:hypothetical protein